MHGRKDFGIVVEDLTDGPVSGTIVTDDLGQPVVAGLETQHGFHSSDASLFPYVVCNHEDKDASFFVNGSPGEIGPQTHPQQKLSKLPHPCLQVVAVPGAGRGHGGRSRRGFEGSSRSPGDDGHDLGAVRNGTPDGSRSHRAT